MRYGDWRMAKRTSADAAQFGWCVMFSMFRPREQVKWREPKYHYTIKLISSAGVFNCRGKLEPEGRFGHADVIGKARKRRGRSNFEG